MNVKDTNPKDAVGVRKAPMSTVPAGVLMELGVAMLEGARKYGRHNYRVAGIRASVYYDGTLRHMMDWWEGVDLDPDSGLSHVTKAIAGLVVLRDAMMNDMWTDDRPPALPAFWLNKMNHRAGEIIDRHPDAKEPFTQGGVEASREPAQADLFEPATVAGVIFDWPAGDTVRIQGGDVPVGDVHKPQEPRRYGWANLVPTDAEAILPGDIFEIEDEATLARFMGEDRFELADPRAVARRKARQRVLSGLPDEGAEGEDEFEQQYDAKMAALAKKDRADAKLAQQQQREAA